MANRFWVGGTGTWDSSTTTHWSTTTGGAGGASVPGTADNATFDGASGGGTVTVDSTLNGTSLGQLTAGAFTGTIDFSVNNPSMTITAAAGITGVSLSGSGSGRIFKLGSGTFTFSNGGGYDFSTVTSAGVQSLASATLVFNSTNTPTLSGQQIVNLGGFAYGTITINGRAGGQGVSFTGNVNGWSAATLNISGACFLQWGNFTGTVTNLNISGSLSGITQIYITPQSTQASLTVTSASVSYAVIRNINFINSVTATNSWDGGENTNLTISNPSASSAGGVIGS